MADGLGVSGGGTPPHTRMHMSEIDQLFRVPLRDAVVAFLQTDPRPSQPMSFLAQELDCPTPDGEGRGGVAWDLLRHAKRHLHLAAKALHDFAKLPSPRTSAQDMHTCDSNMDEGASECLPYPSQKKLQAQSAALQKEIRCKLGELRRDVNRLASQELVLGLSPSLTPSTILAHPSLDLSGVFPSRVRELKEGAHAPLALDQVYDTDAAAVGVFEPSQMMLLGASDLRKRNLETVFPTPVQALPAMPWLGLPIRAAFTSIDLSNNGLGARDALVISRALIYPRPGGVSRNVEGSESEGYNSHIIHMSLAQNCFGNQGAVEIANAIDRNTTLTYLNLSSNGIASGGVLVLAEAARRNCSLICVDLAGNTCGDGALQAMEAALSSQGISVDT